MNSEIYEFTMVWMIAAASACYCYSLSNYTPKGFLRLILVIPVIFLFTFMSFSISSYNLGAPTFFYLVWLANFKLLLFSFDLGPLPQISLPHFVCTLLLPIKARKQRPDDVDPSNKAGFGRWVLFGAKACVVACVMESYEHMKSLPYAFALGLCCILLYLALEMILAITAALAWAFLGIHLAPQFNDPYLTTSLQDFWGYRWNLMVSDILRQTVHNPIREIVSPLIGRKRARLVGILATFLISGLMHELIYYYMTRVSPTWEVTCFFFVNGLCVSAEIVIKEAVSGKWRLHRMISGPLTIGFLAITGVWLFSPQILRNQVHDKFMEEYIMMVNGFKRNKMKC